MSSLLAALVFGANLMASSISAGADLCFPEGSAFSSELCCTAGGLADCFTDDLSFSKCCPGSEGADPGTCFPKGSAFSELVCCSGEGFPPCFEPPFTQRACCYAYWAERKDVLTTLVQQYMGVAASNFVWEIGDFFAEVVNAVGASGPCIELGVQRGNFSATFLQGMSIRHLPMPRYFMVDVWKEEEHYDDDANIANKHQIDNLVAATRAVSKFWKYTTLLQLRTREAVSLFKDEECGFIYVDARHDYCAVHSDLSLYWQKLKPGGVMAGDDFGSRGSNWITCENGEVRTGGVMQAVLDFAEETSTPEVIVTPYNLNDQWFMLKPLGRR